MSKSRLESFSDGVFAFAITLLVLNITVPSASLMTTSLLWNQLGSHWTDYIAYIVSFVTITIMWVNHHALFIRIQTIDRPILLYNNLLLMSVVLVPFSTAVLSKFPSLGPAAFVYGIILSFHATAFNLIWAHMVRSNALIGVGPEQIAAHTLRYRIGLGVYLAATCAAFISPFVSIAAYIAIALLFLVPGGIESATTA